jgi:hypothetical protein
VFCIPNSRRASSKVGYQRRLWTDKWYTSNNIDVELRTPSRNANISNVTRARNDIDVTDGMNGSRQMHMHLMAVFHIQ